MLFPGFSINKKCIIYECDLISVSASSRNQCDYNDKN